MNKQSGMTLISWVFVLGLIAFFALIILRVFPMYQGYFSVKQVLSGMEQELRNQKMTKKQAQIMLSKRFNIGYIDFVESSDIEFFRGKDNTHISRIVIDYEQRVSFIAQISLVGNFHAEANAEPVSK
jgi:type II secretory pathway pseudopilin PulG